MAATTTSGRVAVAILLDQQCLKSCLPGYRVLASVSRHEHVGLR